MPSHRNKLPGLGVERRVRVYLERDRRVQRERRRDLAIRNGG